jgi:hypothetical protein
MEALIRFPPPPPILKEKAPIIMGLFLLRWKKYTWELANKNI